MHDTCHSTTYMTYNIVVAVVVYDKTKQVKVIDLREAKIYECKAIIYAIIYSENIPIESENIWIER